jgi:hypothetical protein
LQRLANGTGSDIDAGEAAITYMGAGAGEKPEEIILPSATDLALRGAIELGICTLGAACFNILSDSGVPLRKFGEWSPSLSDDDAGAAAGASVKASMSLSRGTVSFEASARSIFFTSNVIFFTCVFTPFINPSTLHALSVSFFSEFSFALSSWSQ